MHEVGRRRRACVERAECVLDERQLSDAMRLYAIGASGHICLSEPICGLSHLKFVAREFLMRKLFF